MNFSISTKPLLRKHDVDAAVNTILQEIHFFGGPGGRLEEILAKLNSIEARLAELERKIDSIPFSGGIESMKSDDPTRASGNNNRTPAKPVDDEADQQQGGVKRKAHPVSRRFYAKFSPYTSTLSEVSDTFRDKVPFVCEVRGDRGTVSFNPECAANALAAPAMLEHFDANYVSDSPTAIIPNNTLPIQLTAGNQWLMNGRITLTLR